MRDGRLPFDDDAAPSDASRIDARDRAGRARAIDPRHNVVLEASAGTGKTRVLVQRYVNLLHAGVDPGNILAMTFTRKAATEMRERIVESLREAAARGTFPPSRWQALRDRMDDVAVSTIDAFCLSLLREFPLEADLDPGFTVADDTEVPRLVDDALDRALRVCRSLAREDEHVGLVFAQLGDRRVRAGLAALLSRRLVAPDLLAAYLARNQSALTVASAAERAARALLSAVGRQYPDGHGDALGPDGGVSEALDGLLAVVATGPADPAFALLVSDLERLDTALRTGTTPDPAHVQAACTRARGYFLTQDGRPRTRLTSARRAFASAESWTQHRDLVERTAPVVARVLSAFRRDLNVLVSRGVWRMYRIAEAEYRRTLDAHAVVDFADLLLRTLHLLRQMEEFARSRYRLESRFHHVLVDEFQDTSRPQWELMSLLVQSWGEGAGLTATGPLRPSIFIVGDRKQSIYGFRDADVSVLEDAARHIGRLRPDGDVRRAISRSFRSVPALLAFVNDVGADLDKAPDRQDGFRYEEQDRFPVDEDATAVSEALRVISYDTPDACAAAVAGEVARLVGSDEVVRDPATGLRRAVRPGDVAILFRTRESHREIAAALDRHSIPAYVYKGLGFYDSDEIRDVLALLWHLADPISNRRAAAWLCSGFVGLSDEGLRRLAPHVGRALAGREAAAVELDPADREAFEFARTASARWRALVDRMPAAQLLDLALRESAYAVEIRGRGFPQARENLKKIRGLVRRVQNRGYATLARIVAHLDRLALGDDANAAIDARDAVNLMTVHAAKGLEFPVVFLVNLSRGTSNRPDPIRVAAGTADEIAVSVGDFESDADEDRVARDREETKRLLYVALTRARDRLYLATRVENGQMRPPRGSLAEVLPPGLIDAIVATPSDRDVHWRASSGHVHVLQRCRSEAVPHRLPDRVPDAHSPRSDDFDPIEVSRPAARAATGVPVTSRSASMQTRERHRLRGKLVHRLIQRVGMPRPLPLPAPELVQLARQLIHIEEGAAIDSTGAGDELSSVCVDAVDAYVGLGGRTDLYELYARGDAFFEVPFTHLVDGSAIRGTIDCLVRWRDPASDAATVTILEFKTGRPAPEHASQAKTYRAAAEAMFPGEAVEAQVVYLSAPPPS